MQIMKEKKKVINILLLNPISKSTSGLVVE